MLAKIEKPQAVDNLESIVDAFDGIMVARGDLGVELPLEQVPLVQKRAVTLARRRAKPVIVATQMLDSMVSMTRPTRAEASDVANAVLDGADALMLSGETSVGSHPAHVVRTMARIIEQVEGEALDQLPQIADRNDSTSRSITRAAVNVGMDVGATAVIAFTETGRSAAARRPLPPRPRAARVHAQPAGAQPARAVLGRRDVPRPQGGQHRRDGPAGRRCPAGHRPGQGGRAHHRHRRRAAGHPRHDERHARPPRRHLGSQRDLARSRRRSRTVPEMRKRGWVRRGCSIVRRNGVGPA